jgi:hypothetical protein
MAFGGDEKYLNNYTVHRTPIAVNGYPFLEVIEKLIRKKVL